MGKSYPKTGKSNYRRRRYNRRGNKSLVRTIVRVSKATALKEAETKRIYTNVASTFNQEESQGHMMTLISAIPQAGTAGNEVGEASFENRRIGNSVQPCWLKGFLFLQNLHHGNFDYNKNYSVRVMILKDKMNIVQTSNQPIAYPLYRVEGQAAACTGGMIDHCRPIAWDNWQVLKDSQYKLGQFTNTNAYIQNKS